MNKLTTRRLERLRAIYAAFYPLTYTKGKSKKAIARMQASRGIPVDEIINEKEIVALIDEVLKHRKKGDGDV